MSWLAAVGHALAIAGSMGWKILWALVFGFLLSAVVEAVVRRDTVVGLLGDDRARNLAAAAGLGAASSSCSYAAVALARSLFRKGAHFTSAMTFQIASTNLVIELGVILALLMGWRFTLAELVGGPIVIVLVALVFRYLVGRSVVQAASDQAERGLAGRMEGHAGMDMSIREEGSLLHRATSEEGRSAIASVFVMNWASIWTDLLLGLVVAGALAAWVPHGFWRHVFFAGHGTLDTLWGPIVGPVVAIVSFVCSVGNVPLAAVLWNSGISFGGVVAFLYADLIIIPILLIYRKYYGTRMALVLLGVFYASMVVAGLVVEALFGSVGLVPHARNATAIEASISWDYTTFLDLAAIVVAVVLVVKFVRDGNLPMLRHMGADGGDGAAEDRAADESGGGDDRAARATA
jgi:uncharacterized membrane protein YraQ (UPF0718 family)